MGQNTNHWYIMLMESTLCSVLIEHIFPGRVNPIIKIRWSLDCVILIMGIPTQAIWQIYTENAPWLVVKTSISIAIAKQI